MATPVSTTTDVMHRKSIAVRCGSIESTLLSGWFSSFFLEARKVFSRIAQCVNNVPQPPAPLLSAGLCHSI